MKRGTTILAIAAVVIAMLAVWRATSLVRDPLPQATAALLWMPQKRADAEPRENPARSTALLRPLFSPGQKGDSPAVASTSPAGAGPSQGAQLPRLVGVVADGQQRLAIIAYQGALLRVGENKKVGEWTVVRIDTRSAIIRSNLRSNSKSKMLWLDQTRSKGADSTVESQ